MTLTQKEVSHFEFVVQFLHSFGDFYLRTVGPVQHCLQL